MRAVHDALADVPLDGSHAVTIEPVEDIRTERANRFYWGAVITAAQQHLEFEGLRYSKEALHEFLKRERYGYKPVAIKGSVQFVAARSSKMTKKQFAEFVQWAEVYVMDNWGVPPEMIEGYRDVA